MPNIAETTAAPAMLRIGRLWWRRDLLISPLTLRDLGWYERMGGHSDTVGRKDTILLIWLGLRRQQPWLTWGKCCRLFRRRSRRERAFLITDQINPGTFKTVDLDAVDPDKPTSAFTGHVTIMRAMAAAFQWGPEVAFDLTVEQAHLYLMGDMSKSIDSIGFESAEEARAYVAKRKAEDDAAAARAGEGGEGGV